MIGQVLGANANAIIWLGSVSGYSEGFEMRIHALTKASDSHAPKPFLADIDEMGRQRAGVRASIMYSDGRKGSSSDTVQGRFAKQKPSVGDLSIWPTEGHGGSGRFDQCYWISPLPPQGRVFVAIQWPEASLDATIEIDAAVIAAAAAHAEGVF